MSDSTLIYALLLVSLFAVGWRMYARSNPPVVPRVPVPSPVVPRTPAPRTLALRGSDPTRRIRRRYAPNSWGWIYLAFDGRLNRRAAWTYAVTLWFSFSICALTTFALGYELGLWPVLAIGLLPLYVFLVWANAAVWVKRLHDLNRPGRWYLFMLGGAIGNGLTASSSDFFVVLAVLAQCGIFAFWLYMGFAKGTSGPNRYGPDPLDSSSVFEVSA
jgi:uncharacterized membrane protein YhaH (DUF805 family)